MKLHRYSLAILFALTISIIYAPGVPAQTQKSSSPDSKFKADLRPFDFRDKYYASHGIIASVLIDRHNGTDGRSLFDMTTDPALRGVRVLETLPAYSTGGDMLFWNRYGDLYKDGFTEDVDGRAARAIALDYPIYLFPSQTRKRGERQAALIHIDENYFDKNPLGLGVVILVEFTDAINTDEGKAILNDLEAVNGLSLDGTPIIRTEREIVMLTRMGLVRQFVRGTDEPGLPPYTVGRIIADPDAAIAADAYLNFVADDSGAPLPAEAFFVKYFDCLSTLWQDCSPRSF